MHTHEEAIAILECSKQTLSNYVSTGRIERVKNGRRTFYDEREVARLKSEIEENKKKYRPDLKDREPKPMPQKKEVYRQIISTPETMLDSYGLDVLADMTAELISLGIIDVIDRRALEKYAYACQQMNRYAVLSDSTDGIAMTDNGTMSVHPYHKIMCDYQKMVSNYEKEFGLTPLARQKFAIKEKVEIDEMEALLL